MIDPYQILGLPENASIQDVRKAYKLYVSKLHPDKHNGDPFFNELIKKINEAYALIYNGYSRNSTNPSHSSELNRLKAEIDDIKNRYSRELKITHDKIHSQSNTINELQLKVLSQQELLKKSQSDIAAAYGCSVLLLVFGFGIMALIEGWINDWWILGIFIILFIASIIGNINRILHKTRKL